MVNEKMIEGLYELDGMCFSDEEAGHALQKAINAAWITFDDKDESTWPKTKFAPSGQKWLVETSVLNLEHTTWQHNCGNGNFVSCLGKHAVRYADPQDLMFKPD